MKMNAIMTATAVAGMIIIMNRVRFGKTKDFQVSHEEDSVFGQ